MASLRSSQPFFAFRVLVIANPKFYPDDTTETKRKLIDFGLSVLETERFDTEQIYRIYGEEMSFCLWLTGLPGSGKSTILQELSRIFSESGIEAVTLSLESYQENPHTGAKIYE